MLGLVLTCLFLVANAGHIFPQDIIMSPNNRNTPSAITLVFTLDSPLASTDYLRIVFPFALSSIQPGAWDTYLDCSFKGPGKLATVTASAIVGDTNAFFVQFYTDLTSTSRASLAYNTTYYLSFTATPNVAATVGLNLPIQVYSVSNIVGNWIAYDSNPVFGTVSIASAYPTTLVASSSIPSSQTNSQTLGGDYTVNIDITPKVSIYNRARVDIELTNSAFSLLSCKSVNSTSENIPLLSATFETLASNIIRATIASTLFAGNGAKYRFECSVENPQTAATTTITIKTRMGYQETIVESGVDGTGLQAVAPTFVSPGWDESSNKVLLGWGYEASSPTALKIFGLYKDVSATEKWYQSVKVIFKPKADLSVIDKLQVVISTVNDAAFKVLGASIFHNLPDYSSTDKVQCSVATVGFLTCTNVGQLQAVSYFVSFRFNLASTSAGGTVADFGKVKVQTQAASPVTLIALSSTTLTNNVINTNVALSTSTADTGVIAYSTTKASTPVTTTYVTNGEDIILKFKLKYFANFIPLQLTPDIDRGIEFYTSQALATPTVTPTCTINTLVQTTDVTISDCAVDQLSTFTRLRFRLASFARITSGTPPYSLFSSATPVDGIINFDPVQFTSSQFSSYNYVNENVFDYYARWVEGFKAVNPSITTCTGSSSFFFNSVVHQNGALANLKVGMSFYVSGSTSGNPGNDGTVFPTMIRVTGYLSPSEQTTADRLLLFFNDVTPLDTSNPCFGPTGISCKYVANGLDNTQTNQLTEYTGSRRIEISIDLTQKFNIYIPVSTPTQIRYMGFFITTASLVSDSATTQGIFATQHSKRITSALQSATTLTVDTLGGSTPRIGATGTPQMGTVIDTTIGNMVSGTYVPTSYNSASNVGAAYGYCGSYDFTTASGFAFQPFYTGGTATAEQYCVTLRYSPTASRDMTCQICPVHNTMPVSSVTLSKFTLPTATGQDIHDLVYAVSETNGDFKRGAQDYQSTVLSALSLSTLGLTFSPSDFKKTSKNVYVRLSFTTVATLPKNVRINIIPTGASTSLYITPIVSAGCQVGTITTTSCTPSGSDTNIQMDIIAQGTGWPIATHTIDFMVDAAGTAAGLGSNTTVNFKATIKVNGISALTALHHDSTAQTYTVITVSSLPFVLSNFTYLIQNKGARTIVSFAFEVPSDILVYPSQKISFNLGGIATENTGVVPTCEVRNFTTQLMSNDFVSCDVSDLTQVRLVPKAALTGKYTLILGFLKVPTAASPTGITAKVVGVDGTTTVATTSSALALPTTPASQAIPVPNVVYDRLYSFPGEVGEITITIKPSIAAITNTTYMSVYFPIYYSNNLGYQNLGCTADGLPITCFLIKSRLIQLTAFPTAIPVGTNVKVKIYGVITPVVPGTAGKIFIGLAVNDTLKFQLSEQIEVTDKASNAAPLPGAFGVSSYSVTSNTIRSISDYNISFTTDSVGVRVNKTIAIDLPDRQGAVLRNQSAPIIRVSKTGDSIVTDVQTTLLGSRLKMIIPMDLNPFTSYTFTLKSIKNPDYAVCNMDKPTIIVTDSAENTALLRSAPNIWDAPVLSFVADSTLKTPGWADQTGQSISELALTIGVFSPEVWIVPPTGENFNNDIAFTTTQSGISILPGTIKAIRGTNYLPLRIAAASTLLPSLVLLNLTKNEGFFVQSRYNNLPLLPLTLTTVNVTIPVGGISIVGGGFSLPYEWDFNALNLIPHTELKIDIAVTAPATSPLSIVGPSSITFSPTSLKAGFVFYLATSADPLNPPSFTLSLSGVDAKYYSLAAPTVTVTVVTPVYTAPQITELNVTSDYAPTRQQFSLKTDQMTAVYWHIALEGNLSTTDCLRVRSKYNEGTAFDSASIKQSQYGVFYVPQANTATLGEIGNLLSNERYTYILCPANQLDVMGTAVNGTFQTPDNGASPYEVLINFKQAITRTQLANIICIFNRELQLPNQNVAGMDGTTCTTPSVFDNFASFVYTNVSIYIIGDRRSDTISTVGDALNQFITSIQAQTPSSFLTSFNNTLVSSLIYNLYQSISLQTASTFSLPVINNASIVSTAVTDTTITLSGLSLSSGTGVFYGIASEDTLNVPTYTQIRNKLNGLGSGASGANALYSSDPVSLSFTNLRPETEYIIYYYASNSDRTQYARVTDVSYVKAKTKATRIANGASKIEIALGLGLVLGAALLV